MALMKRAPNRSANWALAMDALRARNARSGSGRSAADCHSANLPLRTNRVVPHETYARQARARRMEGGGGGGQGTPAIAEAFETATGFTFLYDIRGWAQLGARRFDLNHQPHGVA